MIWLWAVSFVWRLARAYVRVGVTLHVAAACDLSRLARMFRRAVLMKRAASAAVSQRTAMACHGMDHRYFGLASAARTGKQG